MSAQFNEAFVKTALSDFLSESRLSLSQVAQRVGLSKGYLSNVKAGKVAPGLNNALRILEGSGADTKIIQGFQTWHKQTYSPKEVERQQAKETGEKLSKEASKHFSTNQSAWNLFLNILDRDDDGLGKKELLERKGLDGVAEVECLVAMSLVHDMGDKYCAKDAWHEFTRDDVYELGKTVIDNQRSMFKAQTETGATLVEYFSVDEKGDREATEIMRDAAFKLKSVVKRRSLAVHRGGRRLAAVLCLDRVKGQAFGWLLCALLALSMQSGEKLFAGGGGGQAGDFGGNIAFSSKRP